MSDAPDRQPNATGGRAPRYWIKTYGCQMNVHDSEKYAGILDDLGYEVAAGPEDADIVLVNTCSVRERAEDKLFSELGRLRLLKEELRAGTAAGEPREILVGVTGCIAQQRGEGIIDRQPAVDFVIGTRAIQTLPEVLADVRRTGYPCVNIEDLVQFDADGAARDDAVRAFVTIMEGCNNYCSFCIVPATRGMEVYRPATDIVGEIRGLGLRGYREVTLLGQNVNSWVCPDSGMEFPELLLTLDDELVRAAEDGGGAVARVRFLTSHPKDLSPRLIDAMAAAPTIAKHLHLPVQSGSDRVLREMNRHYTAASYRDQVSRLREAVPGVGLSTDLIVGFPGETEADFEATMELVRGVEYDSFFSFEYSPRPGTAAVTQYEDDVPAETKRERLLRLQELGRQIQARHNEALVGQQAEVLVDSTGTRGDGQVRGRTSSNHIVNMPGDADLIGRLVDVQVVRHAAHSVYGEIVGGPR